MDSNDPPPGYTPYQTPPPLPPRRPSTQHLSPYTNLSHQPISVDPRSSSTASLVPHTEPSTEPAEGRTRKLLLIYIHGFMGNETSFQSFPAHLHNLLSVTLGPDKEDFYNRCEKNGGGRQRGGYVIHTKVYPKFETRFNISVATDHFSRWLSNFENPNTDVILVGHSMGGILSAQVALLQDSYGQRRHRLLGTISLDTPFLGMHPGVITSGLGSIFRPAPKTPDSIIAGPSSPPATHYHHSGNESGSFDSLQLNQGGIYAESEGVQSSGTLASDYKSPPEVDRFFDKLPQRNFTVVKSKKENPWTSMLGFVQKHHDNLTQATGQYLMSHLEFGGCLADPSGLINRYTRIRRLEDAIGANRVRFVNYYTSSTGRIKPEKEPSRTTSPIPGDGVEGLGDILAQDVDITQHSTVEADAIKGTEGKGKELEEEPSTAGSSLHTPDEPTDDDDDDDDEDEEQKEKGKGKYQEMSHLHPESLPKHTTSSRTPSPTHSTTDLLPPAPKPPENFDYSLIPNKSVRKAAEKESARVWRDYERALKEYEKLIKAREKLLESKRGKRKLERKLQSTPPPPPQPQQKTQQEAELERLEKETERMAIEAARMAGTTDVKNNTSPTVPELPPRKDESDRDNTERKEKEVGKKERDELKRKEKDERKTIKDSTKRQEKELRKQRRDSEKQERRKNKATERARKKQNKQKQQGQDDEENETNHQTQNHSQQQKRKKEEPPKKEKRFCILPNEKDDPCWIKVTMHGVDEVGAHCGLFFLSDVYERLVGDVAGKIEEWITDEDGSRMRESRLT